MRRKDGRAAHPRAMTANSLVSASALSSALGSAGDLGALSRLGSLCVHSSAGGASASVVSSSLGGPLNPASPELPPVMEATPSVEAAAAMAAR